MALDITSYNSSLLLPGQTQRLINNCFNDLNWLIAFEKFSGLDIQPLSSAHDQRWRPNRLFAGLY